MITGLKVRVHDDVKGIARIEDMCGKTFPVEEVEHKSDGSRLYHVKHRGEDYAFYGHEVDWVYDEAEIAAAEAEAKQREEVGYGTW